MIDLCVLDSPIGALTLAARGRRICALFFNDCEDEVRAALARWYPGAPVVRHPDPAGAVTALRAYFAGDLHALDRIEVELNGTAFQKRVWEALRTIEAGRPISYGQLAQSIGAPAAVRAVGAANGANPVAVIVPCHRVIGASGKLTGYGGGLDRKRWLLDHEAPQRRLHT